MMEKSIHENILLEKINEMEKNIALIHQKLDRLLEVYETDCKKMSNHVDFVEGVYEKIKAPFNYIMDTVSNAQVPLIEN